MENYDFLLSHNAISGALNDQLNYQLKQVYNGRFCFEILLDIKKVR